MPRLSKKRSTLKYTKKQKSKVVTKVTSKRNLKNQVLPVSSSSTQSNKKNKSTEKRSVNLSLAVNSKSYPEIVHSSDGRTFFPCNFCCRAFAFKKRQMAHMKTCIINKPKKKAESNSNDFNKDKPDKGIENRNNVLDEDEKIFADDLDFEAIEEIPISNLCFKKKDEFSCYLLRSASKSKKFLQDSPNKTSNEETVEMKCKTTSETRKIKQDKTKMIEVEKKGKDSANSVSNNSSDIPQFFESIQLTQNANETQLNQETLQDNYDGNTNIPSSLTSDSSIVNKECKQPEVHVDSIILQNVTTCHNTLNLDSIGRESKETPSSSKSGNKLINKEKKNKCLLFTRKKLKKLLVINRFSIRKRYRKNKLKVDLKTKLSKKISTRIKTPCKQVKDVILPSKNKKLLSVRKKNIKNKVKTSLRLKMKLIALKQINNKLKLLRKRRQKLKAELLSNNIGIVEEMGLSPTRIVDSVSSRPLIIKTAKKIDRLPKEEVDRLFNALKENKQVQSDALKKRLSLSNFSHSNTSKIVENKSETTKVRIGILQLHKKEMLEMEKAKQSKPPANESVYDFDETEDEIYNNQQPSISEILKKRTTSKQRTPDKKRNKIIMDCCLMATPNLKELEADIAETSLASKAINFPLIDFSTVLQPKVCPFPYCNDLFKTEEEFIEHKIVKHQIGRILLAPNKLKKYDDIYKNSDKKKCPICFKEIKPTMNWRRHLQTHSLERDFICPICKKTFARADHLKKHEKRHLDSLKLLHGIVDSPKTPDDPEP